MEVTGTDGDPTRRSRTLGSSVRSRRWAEILAGSAILALCLGVALVVLFAGMRPLIPLPVWSGLLAACLTGVFVAAAPSTGRRTRAASYAVAVLCSWGLLLGMPAQGMLVVILVVVAAVGIYVVPLGVVAAVVALNTLIIAGHAWSQGASVVDQVATPVFYLFIHLAAVFSTWALQQESRMRAELEHKAVEVTAASVLLEESAKTTERLRISRDLHDLIGHQLTVLNLELEAAKHRGGDGAEQHVDRAAAVAKELLADVRSTVGEMRAAEHGDLAQALEKVAAAVPSLEIRLHVDPEVVVDEDQQAVLVRAAQEIITNTIRHAEAWTLDLEVRQEPGGAVLTGANDGVTAARITPGHGLTGLGERVELIGGTLEVAPRPRFTVTVRLPGVDDAGGRTAAWQEARRR